MVAGDAERDTVVFNRESFVLRCSILMVVAIRILYFEAGFVAQGSVTEKLAGQPSPLLSRQNAEERGPEAKLDFGEPARTREREAAIPVYFRAPQGKAVGSIRAEVAVPQSLWKFQKAEAPKGSWWKISARQKKPAAKEEPAKAGRFLVMELRISAGSRAIREGLIGHLRFRSVQSGSPLPGPLEVRKLEVSPPTAEPPETEPPANLPPMTDEPPLNPAQGCFFFTH